MLNEKLKNIDPNNNNLIVIHLLGSHAKYLARLPEGYPTDFKESGEEYLGEKAKNENFVKNVLNPYDATIKYTDNNLNKIYNTIKNMVPDLSAFVYMPDHGEDVFGQKWHDSSMFTFEMTRIPFVMYFSDTWMSRNQDRYSIIDSHKELPFTTDLFYDCFLGIAGINTNSYESKYDIGDTAYSINWNNAVTMWTDKNLQTQFYNKSQPHKLNEDPEYVKRENIKWLNTQNNDNKYLAIACDSVGAADEALNDGFNGVEINITITNDSIQMGHGPECVLNMSLDDFLSKIPLSKIKKIWLDTKMDDPALIQSAFDQLEMIDKKYNIKSRAILESSLVNDKMKIFEENGWQMTFYFLPRLTNVGVVCPPIIYRIAENKTGKLFDYSPTVDEQMQINIYSSKLAQIITNQKARNVSFWSESYPFILRDVLPKLPNHIDFCTFAIPNVPPINDVNFKNKFMKLQDPVLLDKRVHTILIDPMTLFYITL